jgi:phosphoenolpyruvate carboxykinase (ATP)
MIRAALSGDLEQVALRHDAVFNLDVPTSCPDVPSELLDPRQTWADKNAYDQQALRLARMFVDNFAPFASGVAPAVQAAGPQPDARP